MDVYEITGQISGVSDAGVNYLQPSDSYQSMLNGYVYRQVLQSRLGFDLFAPRVSVNRIMGIFEHTLVTDNTTELLVFDTERLYKWSSGTFVPVPFAGSMAGYLGFNIIAKDGYISGTTYPTADYQNRFVFTGNNITAFGASSVFFYDGTNVKDFTNNLDNTNYSPPLIGGVPAILNKAKYVCWYGERLNFISPTISDTVYPQSVLYSGIRTSSGNGDKFNVAGSGQLNADTYEYIKGFSLFGQILSVNFNRSNWILEKTRDAFNPYYFRKVPSVLGTDADFSAVSWNDEVRSLGKTGILGTDARSTLKVDNKIPNFTANQIDQVDFNLTYGGFDRVNNQYLWAYKQYETDSETQNKVLVNNYEEESWSINDTRFSVFGQCDLGLNLNWNQIENTGTDHFSWKYWNTTEDIWNKIGIGRAVQKTLAGDDLGFVYELNVDCDDYYAAIGNITTGATTTLTVSANGIITGDQVVIQDVEGMTEINNFDSSITIDQGQTYVDSIVNFQTYDVLSATPTSIEINLDSSMFSPYVLNTGSISKAIDFSAMTIPFNPYRSIGRRVYVSHVEFLIDTNGGWLCVDCFSNGETPYKINTYLIPQNLQENAEWITMTVDNEANFFNFQLRQNSPGVQVKLTSMRIHCAMGGLTSG